MKGYIVIIATLLLVVSVLITLNIFFQQSLQFETAEQFNKQQLLLAGSIAENIGSYISFATRDVLNFSHMVSHEDVGSRAALTELTRSIPRDKTIAKTCFGVLSQSGDLVFYEGDEKVLRPYMQKIAGKGRSLKDGVVSVIDAPSMLFVVAHTYGGKRPGQIVFLSIGVNDIVNYFVRKINAAMGGYASIADAKGTLLYHLARADMIGKNLLGSDQECLSCHVNFDLERKILRGEEKGEGRYIAPSGTDKVLAFSAARAEGLSWIIFISAPYSEITYTTKESMKLYSYLIISILATTIVISTLLVIFNKKRIQATEIEKRQEEMEQYAIALEEKVSDRTSELMNEKEKLNTIVSAIGSGIILFDRNGRIQWSNQAIRDMAGMDVVGMTCEELCSDCQVSGSYSQNNVETSMLSNLFGHIGKYYQVTTAPVTGENGELHGYIRLIQDVTEIKKMEEQMTNSEKLASIGRLAAGIAHEIGNPLTSIFSFVQILREVEQDEFKKESLKTIYFHINRISEILKQLSGFTKMPLGEPKKCQINETIESSMNLIQYDKKAKDISFVKELSPSLPEITADCNQLSQVFVNLILNAVDAMPDGGTLTVRSFINGSDIVLQFRDTGIGIPGENLMKIFDPFYTTKEKGTGLGLAVSYNIVKKMNGTLAVESKAGSGSTFTITLPVSKNV